MTSILSYGAVADGQTLATAAIQKAIDACAAQGGGTVVVPAGRWVTGALFFASGVELHLESGATLVASRNVEDFPLVQSRWEGQTRTVHAPLIGGEGLTRIALTGRGTVDGQGDAWWGPFRAKKLDHPRPRLIAFTGCRDVLIDGVHLVNSPAWTVNPVSCSDVRIHGITIHNPSDSPNTDGINPDSCNNVIISDCLVSVGDDCITIKSGTEDESADKLTPCRDIVITNCILERGHGGLVIGSEMSGGVKNLVLSNCIFRGTDRGIRLKSRRGRGGTVENIRVSNVIMEDVLCPLTLNLYYHCNGGRGVDAVSNRQALPVTSATPAFKQISLTGIRATGVKLAAAWVWGLPEAPIEGLSLKDVSIVMDEAWAVVGEVEMADGVEAVVGQGFFGRNVKGLELTRVTIQGARGPVLDVDATVVADGTLDVQA
jgi:polygalacturonase